uniref:DUF5666 domain-containing protein n=1 Tax=Thaumasiovibrio occultus TaxID=1891184 RepID=UPI000B35BE50|nr:DUF5666 domain-containing protein [Thaumasiovibrio occultus]
MKKVLLLSAISMMLTGCGGSSDSANTGGGTTPITPADIVSGAIDAVNSDGTIVVNGNTYPVGNVALNGTELAEDVLAKNMTVTLRSTSARSAAVNVQLEPTMTGTITAINGNSFEINGVTLSFAGLSGVEVGDWVLVSSLPTANAGYKVLSVVKLDVEVEYPSLATYFELEGRIASVNANDNSLVLGSNIHVDYSGAHSVPSPLQPGQWIEVEGRYEVDRFVATEIELDGYDDDNDDLNSEIEGIVTSVEDADTGLPSFSLNYRGSFATDSATCYRQDDANHCDASLKSQLNLGAEVEVISTLKAGRRVATLVEFEDLDSGWQGREFECEGMPSNVVVDVDTNTATFAMSDCEDANEHPLPIERVYTDAMTRFDGIDIDYLAGSHVEVEGVLIGEQYIAREIELDD